MILDKIENYKLYVSLNERIARAFTYIIETDFSQIALGKHLIENEDIFALVQEYNTKEIEDCKLESHKKYIDVQYMISGDELMGITTLNNQEIIEKNEENDYFFYNSNYTPIRVNEGMFTIFFPDDIHMPCIKVETTQFVKKVVVKVKI